MLSYEQKVAFLENYLLTKNDSYGDSIKEDIYFYFFSPSLVFFTSENKSKIWLVGQEDQQGRKDLYLFTFDVSLYTLNKEYFGYTELAPYNSVAITNAQLRDILSPKDFYARWPYIDSFTKIYIIDLDSPNPRQTSKYKIIEVKLYYWSKNR